jgi:hypothetical protein
VCIGHGQGTSRVTDPVKKIVTNPAHGPAASGATNPARMVLPRLPPLFGLYLGEIGSGPSRGPFMTDPNPSRSRRRRTSERCRRSYCRLYIGPARIWRIN